MMTPVIRTGVNPNFQQFGNYYAQQDVDDGENAMYYQTIDVCPNTVYRISVYGQIRGPQNPAQAALPRPYCEFYICENTPNKCGRRRILAPNNKKRTGYRFTTRNAQTKAQVQVFIYCPGTSEGRTNRIWTDNVEIVKLSA
jgi:hypothetical protein